METIDQKLINIDSHKCRIELKNADFADVINGCYYEPGTRVVIYKGKIEKILRNYEGGSDFKAGIELDLKGKRVIPGLFNTHCHIQMTIPSILAGPGDMISNKLHWHEQLDKNMHDCLIHGVTHIRDAWTDSLMRNQSIKQRIDNGKLLGPRIYQSILIGPENGNFTTKRSRLVKAAFRLRNMPTVDFSHPDSGVVTFPPHAGQMEIRHAIDCAIDERGAKYIKIYEQKQDWFTGNFRANFMTQEQLNTLADYAHSRGVKTTIHQVTLESFRRALHAGIWSFAHLPNNGILTEKDLQAFIDSGTVLEPTASVLYYLCWKIKNDELKKNENMQKLSEFRSNNYKKVSEEFWIKPLHERFIKGFEKHFKGKFRMGGLMDASPLFRIYARSILIGAENLNRLYESGAILASGNDAGAVCSTQAMINHELDMINLVLGLGSIKRRYSGLEALRIATINSARAMGLDAEFGSIDVGKTADLVVIEGDPLSDYGVIGNRADALFLNGRLLIDNCGLSQTL